MIDAGCLMVFAYVLSRGPQSPKGLTIRLPPSSTTSYLLCTYDMTGSCFLPSRCRLIADTVFTDPGVGSRLSASSVVELLIVSRRQFDAREMSVDIVTTKENGERTSENNTLLNMIAYPSGFRSPHIRL